MLSHRYTLWRELYLIPLIFIPTFFSSAKIFHYVNIKKVMATNSMLSFLHLRSLIYYRFFTLVYSKEYPSISVVHIYILRDFKQPVQIYVIDGLFAVKCNVPFFFSLLIDRHLSLFLI